MRKRKMVQSNLIKNSTAAYFAAIEIHNKPNIPYRYETTTLLMMNAWELVLKAFTKKFIKKKSIYTKDGHTISIDKAIDYVEEYINSTEPKAFTAIKENLLLIEQYRNNIVHYYNEQLPESRRFIESMVNIITDLDKNGVDDTIVVGFDIYLENVKRMKNSDLLVAITSQEVADVNFAKVSRVQITDDPDAQKVSLSDEEFVRHYPLQYSDVCAKCRAAIPGFKQSKRFNNIMAIIKSDSKLAFIRKLNPHNSQSSKTTFYSEATVDEVIKMYTSTLDK